MADRKISDLTALTTPASGDYLPIVDISEAAAASKNKRITIEELMRGVPNGTAAAPGIAFETDPNTGIYSPGADQLAVATNGTGRVFVDASGRVGVGTSIPGVAGEFVGTGSDGVLRVLRSVGAGVLSVADHAGRISLGTSSAGSAAYIGGRIEIIGAETWTPGTAQGSNLVFSTVPVGSTTLGERLRITAAGLVGIGNSAPAGILDVAGASFVRFANSTAPTLSNDTHAGEALFLRSGGSAGDNNVQALLAFGKADGGSLRSGSAIGAVQTTADADQVGLAFYTSSSSSSSQTLGERVRITHAGNVAIGNTSPDYKLEVASSDNSVLQATCTSSTGANNIVFDNNAGARIGLTSYGSSYSGGSYLNVGVSSQAISTTGDLGITVGSGKTIRFGINNVEAARIDSSSRLLVGTSTDRGGVASGASHTAIFEKSNTEYAQVILATNQNNTNGAYLTLIKSRGTTANSRVIVSSGDDIGAIAFEGSDGTNSLAAARITAVVDGTPGTNDMPGRLVFSTTADGAASPTERVRLTNTGALLVGTTTTPTGAGSGAVVAQDRMVISSINAGRHQVIAGDIGTMTATTGTVVFKFKATGGTAKSCYVKLAIANRANNNTPSNLPAAEYAFQLHKTGPGVCSLNGATTVFEFTYVYATHVAFANLGSGECTVTLTNPTTVAQTGSYKVEVLTEGGFWTLDSITTT